MKNYRISYNGSFFNGSEIVCAKSKRKAIKKLKKEFKKAGMKIRVTIATEVKEGEM